MPMRLQQFRNLLPAVLFLWRATAAELGELTSSQSRQALADETQCTCSDHRDSNSLLQVEKARKSKRHSVAARKVEKLAGMEPESEENCEFVNKRGIMLSCDVHPLKPLSDSPAIMLLESAARNLSSSDAVQYYIQQTDRLGDGVVVYVVTTALPSFQQSVLPHVKSKFVLVTGDAVVSPEEALGEEMFRALADDQRVLKWFAQNANLKHPKLASLPNGLDYHTLKSNGTDWGPRATPLAQEAQLKDVRRSMPRFENRSELVHDGTFALTNRIREMVHDVLDDQPNLVHYTTRFSSRRDFWTDVAKYRFGASPAGKGVDCHRTWEMLLLGTVPLVNAGPHNRVFHDHQLPVVELSDLEWNQLGSAGVRKKMQDAARVMAANQEYSPSSAPALTLQYWVDQIRMSAKGNRSD